MCELTYTMFNEWLQAVAKNHAYRTMDKPWGLIKKCITFAEIKGDIPSLHLKELINPPSEKTVGHKKKKIPVPNVSEVTLIEKEANKKFQNGKPIYGNAAKVIILIMYTGLRASEVIGLKWKNVDIENKEIHIDETLSQIHEEDSKKIIYVQEGAKTDKSNRDIPLPEKALEVIKYFSQYSVDPDDFVCVTSNHNHYTRGEIERSLKRIVNNSDCVVKTYSPHGLRHGYGSILLSQGADIKRVSELLGHSDVSFTYNTYIDIFKEDKKATTDLLNKI